jgi:hypothetical protein
LIIDGGCDVRRVLSKTKEQTRLRIVKPRKTHKVQAWVFGDPSLLYWIALGVEDRKLYQAEIKP